MYGAVNRWFMMELAKGKQYHVANTKRLKEAIKRLVIHQMLKQAYVLVPTGFVAKLKTRTKTTNNKVAGMKINLKF
jgi:hypothetical protein